MVHKNCPSWSERFSSPLASAKTAFFSHHIFPNTILYSLNATGTSRQRQLFSFLIDHTAALLTSSPPAAAWRGRLYFLSGPLVKDNWGVLWLCPPQQDVYHLWGRMMAAFGTVSTTEFSTISQWGGMKDGGGCKTHFNAWNGHQQYLVKLFNFIFYIYVIIFNFETLVKNVFWQMVNNILQIYCIFHQYRKLQKTCLSVIWNRTESWSIERQLRSYSKVFEGLFAFIRGFWLFCYMLCSSSRSRPPDLNQRRTSLN